ncbi:MAG: ankyrin repeat domain-containing protein, partial [Proteobacteria bacterium]|nr:ankyrin repeat domain-containing protein [Pseudomonadota bacterium]
MPSTDSKTPQTPQTPEKQSDQVVKSAQSKSARKRYPIQKMVVVIGDDHDDPEIETVIKRIKDDLRRKGFSEKEIGGDRGDDSRVTVIGGALAIVANSKNDIKTKKQRSVIPLLAGSDVQKALIGFDPSNTLFSFEIHGGYLGEAKYGRTRFSYDSNRQDASLSDIFKIGVMKNVKHASVFSCHGGTSLKIPGPEKKLQFLQGIFIEMKGFEPELKLVSDALDREEDVQEAIFEKVMKMIKIKNPSLRRGIDRSLKRDFKDRRIFVYSGSKYSTLKRDNFDRIVEFADLLFYQPQEANIEKPTQEDDGYKIYQHFRQDIFAKLTTTQGVLFRFTPTIERLELLASIIYSTAQMVYKDGNIQKVQRFLKKKEGDVFDNRFEDLLSIFPEEESFLTYVRDRISENPKLRKYLLSKALISSIYVKNYKLAKDLLDDFKNGKNDLDINFKNKEGNTALIIAVVNKNKEMASYLIENGADVDVSNVEGCTALMVAVYSGQDEIAISLLEHGADPYHISPKSLKSLLEKAQILNKPKAVKTILEDGSFYDIIVGDYDVSPLNIRHIKPINRNAKSIVEWAIEKGHIELIPIFLRKTISLGFLKKEVFSKLWFSACEKGEVELAKVLFDKRISGYDLMRDAQDDLGETKLMKACKGGHFEIIERFLDSGRTSVNKTSKQGETALMMFSRVDLAAVNEAYQKAIIDQFIAKKVDLTKKDNSGQTASDLARVKGNVVLADYIDEKIAEKMAKKSKAGKKAAKAAPDKSPKTRESQALSQQTNTEQT